MSEAKHTPGPYKITRSTGSTVYLEGRAHTPGCLQEIAAFGITEVYGQTEANVNFALDAFETLEKTGQTPRQLAEQVKVLREALEALDASYDRIKPTGYPLSDAQKKARAALAATEWGMP